MKNKKVYFIAEAGLNHNGDINIAKKLIDVAVEANSDAVKFQKREVNQIATKDVLDAPFTNFPELGKTYREVRESLELYRMFDEPTDEERKEVIKEAKGILDVENVLTSIYLIEDLRVVKK